MKTAMLFPVFLLTWLLVGLNPMECRGDVAPLEETREQERLERVQAEKERLTRVSVVLFWLVVALGVLMMAAVIVWGMRTRRITGGKLPEVTAADPLWYLQPGEQRAALPPPVVKSPPSSETDDSAH